MFKRAYVEITNVCNLHCVFCPGTTREKQFMTPNAFSAIARKLRPYTDYLYLHVMGEPLLHPQLAEILEIADLLRFRVCITTNGTLLPTLGDTLLRPCVHKVSVSLHSFEGNAGEDPECYLEGVWRFSARSASIIALRLWNQGGAEARNGEIMAYLSRKLGCDIAALPEDCNGNRRLGEKLYLENAEKFDWPNTTGAEQYTQFCHGLRQQIAVLCNGTVVPCCLDSEGTIALGNLLTEDMEAILASPRVKAICEGFDCRQPTEDLCRRCGYATRFNR